MSLTLPNALKKAIAAFLIVIVLVLSSLFIVSWRDLSRPVSAVYYSPTTPQELEQAGFRKGTTGVPFWVWVVLPRLFPEKLPSFGGYTSLGLTWEQGQQLPAGLTQEQRGVARVILTSPTPPFNLSDYRQFLQDCAQDPRFTPSFILPEITYNVPLSLREKLLYRLVLIPSVKTSLSEKIGDI